MNSMRIIGCSNPNIKSVNRITYVVDTNEVVAYVNKSILLGRYPNIYYAYEAARGAATKCGCKDMLEFNLIPINIISNLTLVPTGLTNFQRNVTLSASGPSYVYNSVEASFYNTTGVTVLTPIFTAPEQVSFYYKLSASTITAPTGPENVKALGFTPVNSGDSIVVPTGNPNSNTWFLRLAPYWNESSVFTAPVFTVNLISIAAPLGSISSTNITFS